MKKKANAVISFTALKFQTVHLTQLLKKAQNRAIDGKLDLARFDTSLFSNSQMSQNQKNFYKFKNFHWEIIVKFLNFFYWKIIVKFQIFFGKL